MFTVDVYIWKLIVQMRVTFTDLDPLNIRKGVTLPGVYQGWGISAFRHHSHAGDILSGSLAKRRHSCDIVSASPNQLYAWWVSHVSRHVWYGQVRMCLF